MILFEKSLESSAVPALCRHFSFLKPGVMVYNPTFLAGNLSIRGG
jgi:hypothetical protein